MFPPALSYYTTRILPEGEQLIYTLLQLIEANHQLVVAETGIT